VENDEDSKEESHSMCGCFLVRAAIRFGVVLHSGQHGVHCVQPFSTYHK
jgi:hypothetical protein